MAKIYIVSHTHWDREWYRPFQYFRVKLVYAMDRVLDTLENDEAFPSYLFDGQTVILEDYLQVKPQNRERIEWLIREGRLIVGPWYTQPDEFAPDGESLIRNLLIGMNIANGYGRCMMVGYLPDSFGQSGQMPQILRGFGIDSAMMMRGVPAYQLGQSAFQWQGLNGDTVLGIYFPEGYSCGMFWPDSRSRGILRMKDMIKKLRKWSSTEHMLVMNGVDHQFIQPHMTQQIQSLNTSDKRNEYIHGTVEAYIEQIKQTGVSAQLQGELTSPDRNRVHTSIISTRMYQKIANRHNQIMLERYAEPICTQGWLMGATYPGELINEAWKSMFKNQAHDGICGCSTDAVHREIDQRYADVSEIAQTLTKGMSRAMARQTASKGLELLVFNNAMVRGRQRVQATVYTRQAQFNLIDTEGHQTPYVIESQQNVDAAQMSIWTLYLGTEEPLWQTNIAFNVDFDCNVGYTTYRIGEGKRPQAMQSRIFVDGHHIETPYAGLDIHANGTFSLLSKVTGNEYPVLHVLEDCGDAGDTYNFSPVNQDQVIRSTDDANGIVEVLCDGMKAVANIQMLMTVPACLAEGDQSRSTEQVDMPVQVKVIAYADTPRIDIETTVVNEANDHRLRALFDAQVVSEFAYAETQFGTITRQTVLDTARWQEEKWSEKPLPIYAMQRFVNIHDESSGLTILNQGISEYEIYQGDTSTLAVTLFRGVGMMGKPDLSIRPGRPSGIVEPTADAQCHGTTTYHYAILPHGQYDEGEIQRIASIYTAPPWAVQNHIDMKTIQKKFGMFIDFMDYESLSMRMGDGLQESMDHRVSFITLDHPDLQISAVKKAESRDSLIVRIYNPTQACIPSSAIDLHPHCSVGYATNLGEIRQRPLDKIGSQTFELPEFAPYTVQTFEWEINH